MASRHNLEPRGLSRWYQTEKKGGEREGEEKKKEKKNIGPTSSCHYRRALTLRGLEGKFESLSNLGAYLGGLVEWFFLFKLLKK